MTRVNMRKVIVLTFITLDGIMQAPGGPQEDTSGGFAFGGWSFPYADEFSGKLMSRQMSKPFDLLLGRKTYEIFSAYWPRQAEAVNPVAKAFNKAKKYVASHSALRLDWKNSELLTGDVAEAVRKLKESDGVDLQVHGSGNLIQTLLRNDLVDELWLKIHPLTLGSGKRLFAEGAIPAAFTLLEAKVTPTGVIFADYRRAPGQIKTGSF